jgi:ABC-2 type transport system ATP-binding protein
MISRGYSKAVSPQPEVLVAEGLQKSYGARLALQGLTFTLKAGHILGFLGPNGAGKTTSIRILTTMIEPESGRFVVDGIGSEHPQQIRRKIGVLPENLGFPRQMTALEYLLYFGQLYGQTAAETTTVAQKLLNDVGLHQRRNSLIGTYGHGMKQRLGIARALINKPVVLFLDEPTLGLDPRGQQDLLELIKYLSRECGMGVVLCSHMISEIESVCDDVVILSAGQMVAKGTVAEVIGRTQQNIVLRNGLKLQVLPASVAKAMQILKATPSVTKVSRIGATEGWLHLELIEPVYEGASMEYRISNSILGALIRAKILILNFEVEGGRLQDVFMHLTEEVIT